MVAAWRIFGKFSVRLPEEISTSLKKARDLCETRRKSDLQRNQRIIDLHQHGLTTCLNFNVCTNLCNKLHKTVPANTKSSIYILSDQFGLLYVYLKV